METKDTKKKYLNCLSLYLRKNANFHHQGANLTIYFFLFLAEIKQMACIKKISKTKSID